MNPVKCTFQVNLRKLLGYIISNIGIEMDLAKVNTTQAMPEPTIERDVRSLLGCLNYINRFIS